MNINLGNNVILNKEEFARLFRVMNSIGPSIGNDGLVEITLMSEGILIESECITTIVHIDRQSVK